MNLFDNSNSGAQLTDFKDPFGKDCVEGIWFWIRKEWKDRIVYESQVKFKNGNTKGEHNMNADNFIDLVKKTEEFIKSL